MVDNIKKQILRYYLLAVWVLLGYYVGNYIGLLPFTFKKSLFVQTILLVIWYGTWLIPGDLLLSKILK